MDDKNFIKKLIDCLVSKVNAICYNINNHWYNMGKVSESDFTRYSDGIKPFFDQKGFYTDLNLLDFDKNIKEKKVIYILLLKGIVIYVGHSDFFYKRINQHKRDKPFDEIIFIEKKILRDWKYCEAFLIRIFSPFFNIDQNNQPCPVFGKQTSEYYNEWKNINNILNNYIKKLC